MKHSNHYYFFSPNPPIYLQHSNSLNLLSMTASLLSKKHDKRRAVTVLVQEYHRGEKREREKYMYNSAVSDLRPAPLPSAFTGVTAP